MANNIDGKDHTPVIGGPFCGQPGAGPPLPGDKWTILFDVDEIEGTRFHRASAYCWTGRAWRYSGPTTIHVRGLLLKGTSLADAHKYINDIDRQEA